MSRTISLTFVCLILYCILVNPFVNYLNQKPYVEKLGYVPSVTALKVMAVDQKEFVAASLVLKVLMYFGGLSDKTAHRVEMSPDYLSMSRLLHGAVKLDPYNMDAYYFAQSFLTWDVKQYKIANDLLEYGMRYRTWDWYLPFYAGFNYAYFLKNYTKASEYFKLAGELSGSDLSIMLAGRYLQESGQTDLAIAYLASMIKGERNPAIRKSYVTRLAAFKEARRVEISRDRYLKATGLMPAGVKQLISSGYLFPPPKDPYGGEFYFDKNGKVSTTSKFAYLVTSKKLPRSGAFDEFHRNQ